MVFVPEGADAADVARLLLDTGYKSVPVVRAEEVVGVVSRRDLIHAPAITDERIGAQVEPLLADAGHPEWTVEVEDGEVVITATDSTHRLPGGEVEVAKTLARTVPGVRSVQVASAPGRAAAVPAVGSGAPAPD